MKVHVFIATTQGPIAVQRVVAEEPDVQSVVCVDGGIEPLPISSRYHDFVRKGTGLIQRDFGQPAYRMDVSGRIDQGNSWQLPTYMAHHLSSEGLLGEGEPEAGDAVIWATGALKADKSVITVEEVYNKLQSSQALFESLWQKKIPVLVLVPAADEGALERWRAEVKDDVLVSALLSCQAVENIEPSLVAFDSFIHRGEDQTECSMSPFGVPAITDSQVAAPVGPALEDGSEQVAAAVTTAAPKSSFPVIITLAGLAVLAAMALGYFLVPVSITTGQKVELVVETGRFSGDCNQNYIFERVLYAQDNRFQDVALDRLCALWVETSPNVKTVIGIALDNGALLPIQFNVDRWRIALPKQKYKTREYALLTLDVEYLDPIREALQSQLVKINAKKNGVDLQVLEAFLQQQGLNGQVWSHSLVYKKKTVF